MLTCKKCGFELHEDQKVCIQCGTRTIRGDGFDYEHLTWKPTRRMKMGALAVAFLVLIAIVANALRVLPPDQVASQWYQSIAQGDVKAASAYVTTKFTTGLQDRGMDVRSLVTDINGEISGSGAKFSLGKLVMNGESAAAIPVTLTYPDGRMTQSSIELVKDGRRWMIDALR